MKKVILVFGILFSINANSQMRFPPPNWITLGGGYSNYTIANNKVNGFNVWIEKENVIVNYSQTINDKFNRDSAYNYMLLSNVSTIKPNTSNGMSRSLGVSYRFYKKKKFNVILGSGVQHNEMYYFKDTPKSIRRYDQYVPYVNLGTSIDIKDRFTFQIQSIHNPKFKSVFSVGIGYIFYYAKK